ncbi:MAG: CocE/NonD family hydrolase [Gemmatimonadota bacterium]|nr:CocE/NonD family hydrolase [Gemmatimonadota bacterium]
MTPHRFVALTAALLLPSLGSAQSWSDVSVERDVMISARDGVPLATDIYRPASDGVATSERLPVLLQRTPYGKHTDRFSDVADYFARHGYVVAVQDMRGRYASGGEFFKYHRFDAPDGYDTVEWLAQQHWSDGRVGMWGTSYGAHTQADAAKLNPPGLATMVINQGGMANGWDHAIRRGGAFELGREMTWAWQEIPREIDDPVVRELFANESVHDWYSTLPLREGLSPLAAAPNFEAYFLNELRSSDYGEFWKGIGLNWAEYYEETADVPMIHIGGWYDIFLRGTIQNYRELNSLKSSTVRLLVGPWTHSGNTRQYAGDVDFGADAAISDFGTDWHLRWFDHFLKGEDTEAANDAPVRIFVMGTGDGHRTPEDRLYHGGFWSDAESWPPSGTVSTSYYLRPDGSLSQSAATGARSSSYTFDPTHPVPTLGGSVSARLRDGAYDQRERPDFPGSSPPYLPLRARQDVLVFQTPPVEQDVTVIGPIVARLFVSSSAVDTDFVVRLVDVYPPSADFPTGYDMNLTDGIVRMSYRNGRTTRDLIEPERVYEVEIEAFPTANVFKAGHRIRIDVTSSNFPRWDVNPNTGEPLGMNRRTVEALNTVWHSADRPSLVVLPIQPAGR